MVTKNLVIAAITAMTSTLMSQLLFLFNFLRVGSDSQKRYDIKQHLNVVVGMSVSMIWTVGVRVLVVILPGGK